MSSELRIDSGTRFVKNKLREFYVQFISLKGDPRKIAMGMAIGVFIGVTPTIPFHTIIIIFLTMLFRQNLTAAMLGAWIMNPITIPLFYFVEYEIGKLVLGSQHLEIVLHAYSVDELMAVGWHILPASDRRDPPGACFCPSGLFHNTQVRSGFQEKKWERRRHRKTFSGSMAYALVRGSVRTSSWMSMRSTRLSGSPE